MASGTLPDGKQDGEEAPAVRKYEEPEFARMIPTPPPVQSAGGLNVVVKGPRDIVVDHAIDWMKQFEKAFPGNQATRNCRI